MCFSPTASFLTAGVTGLIGIVAMSRVAHPRELPLAAMPVFFAIQQATEGFLWLNLPAAPHSQVSNALVLAFLVFAQAFWPTFAPLAALSIEPVVHRRRLMYPWLAVGIAVSGYLLFGLLTRSPSARIIDDHIVYLTPQPHARIVEAGYLAAIGLPLLMSTRHSVAALGVVVSVGCAVAYGFYLEAFQSVWCYFAAAGSVVILAHFEWTRRGSLRPVAS